MPILESALIVKGAIVLGKFLAAKVAPTALYMGAKQAILTFGISKILAASATVCLVVGAIVWTKERIDTLTEAIKSLENNNMDDAVKNFAKLAIDLDLAADLLPNEIETVLQKKGIPYEKAHEVAQVVSGLEAEIKKEIEKLT